jgi:predicted transport protein
MMGVADVGDIKLFHIHNNTVTELTGKSMTIEKSLQTLMERHLEVFLGVKFLASEYSTGKSHSGRIDTLGIDENYCPVIIEYKRSLNENVINQGLFYLDWLLDHRAEFKLLVMEKYGMEMANQIDWSTPRLLCIAGGFTRYDEHAVQQINRNIELYQYKYYDNEFLLLDLVNATTGQVTDSKENHNQTIRNNTVSDYLTKASTSLTDLFENLKSFITALGDDVQVKQLKHYIAFKRIKNFACVEVHPHSEKLLVYVKVNPETVELEQGFSRDVRNIGHYGTGDLEITIKNQTDLDKAKKLIETSYELN